MTRKTKINLKNIFLALSGVVTVVFYLREIGRGTGEVSPFGILILMLWVTGPYLLFWLATYLLERFSSIRQVPGIGFGISILVFLYTMAAYLQPLNHESSTEGLILIFVPLWLYLTVLPLLGLCVSVAWLFDRLAPKKPTDNPAEWM